MARKTLLGLLTVLSALGLLDSLYLAEKAMTNSALFCDIGAGLDGCNIVAQSPYSQLFGVIPLAYIGVLFYVLLLLAVLVAWHKHTLLRHRALLTVALLGALFSVVFLFIQFVLIKALCIYCIASAVIAFLSLGAAWYLDTKHQPAVVP